MAPATESAPEMIPLIRHRLAPAGPVTAIGIHMAPVGRGLLDVRFELRGDIDRIVVPTERPADAPAARADRLWTTTCLELFIRPKATRAYREYNLAPSGQWALYDFTDTRTGMSAPAWSGPQIVVNTRATGLVLQARLECPGNDDHGFLVGASAVIETKGGQIEHWALGHPPGPPDFHHDRCFVLDLPVTGG